jgi:hypothetical protein
VDLGEESFCFPVHIVSTSLRPDLVVWSDTSKKLCLVELTICYETGFEEAARRKRTRYAELAAEAAGCGYSTSVIPVQVGSRGVLDEAGLLGL